MERTWQLKKKNTEFKSGLDKKYHPVVLQLLANRGISESSAVENFLNADYTTQVLNPYLYVDMEKAVSRIIEARAQKQKIAIFGDYDADGVTATSLLYEFFSQAGFSDILTYIPDRQLEGYGMNPEAVGYLITQGVKLIITADCGITAFDEVGLANQAGVDVIITDHHHVPDRLPPALAIINPHQENCGYPFAELSGVGVAFKLAQAVAQKFDPAASEQLKWLLDLVVVGTVADCVPLVGENRVLTKYGLIVLSKTRRQGFLEMFRVGKISIDENNIPDPQKISFQIAPRINAAGRMDHANVSFELLIEKDPVRARDMALELESKNQERQKITAEIVREIRIIANNSFKDKKLIFVSNEHWPVGILGLVAGKIADEFGKPTVVLQKQGTVYVGSLRSIPQVNIIEALEKCSDLLVRFGGHAQAAGIRVAHKKTEKFYEKLSEIVEQQLGSKEIIPELAIDMEVKAGDISWDLVSAVKKLEPFGEGNPEPNFLLKDLYIMDVRVVGNGSKHLKLSLRPADGSPKNFEAIGFGLGDKFPELGVNSQIDIVFNLQEDEWNGNKKIQLKIIDLRIV